MGSDVHIGCHTLVEGVEIVDDVTYSTFYS